MSRNDKLIPIALQAIESKLKNTDGTLEKEFEGYVSSFGSSIIQSGLLATLAFYTDGDGDDNRNPLENTDGRRNRFLQAIMFMIDREYNEPLLRYIFLKVYGRDIYDDVANLPDLTPLHNRILNNLEKQIIQCSIALKLAIRTYKLKD